ncbi:MAG TPA: hypothetical protein VIA62_01800 [Thermoanaerobaculia bacterium]|jgi:hypothetical protein|nr:hypothetical protein [Thermoanaerobaculia bacterium]
MAAKGFSFSERLSRSSVLVTNAKEHLTEVPFLADDIAALDRLVQDGRALESRQDDLRSQSQENTKKMKLLASQADKLRSRLSAGLQSKYGFANETLLKFGVKLRRPPRRKAAAKPVPPPTTAPTPSTPSPTTPSTTQTPAAKPATAGPTGPAA